MDVSVVGLGKLGSPMAACFAARAHRVVGVDLNERFVAALNAGRAPVFEPGLQEMIDRGRHRLAATTDLAQGVADTDATFLIVPTPSTPAGGFSVDYVLQAAEAVGQGLRRKPGYHLVTLTSTVMPGDTAGQLLPALERHSGKKCGRDFGLCYSPEFIALGSVIRNFLNPDFLLIGESDARAGDLLTQVYQGVVENRPPVARMSFANAELTKLALNTYVTTKISYANMLAELCEHLDGGDVDVVTAALGLDARIGAKCLKGSLGYGGPCFPRDNTALVSLALQLGVPALLPQATDEINRRQAPRVAQLVRQHLPRGGTAGVLGLAYKTDTNCVERSQGLEIAQALLAGGTPVVVHDPHAMEGARPHLQGPVRHVESASACARVADVLVVATPDRSFRTITAADLARPQGLATVIDCWRLLPRLELSAACHYIALGTADVALPGDQAAPALRRAA
jgi:UDPglucose 6-dehydrogenase